MSQTQSARGTERSQRQSNVPEPHPRMVGGIYMRRNGDRMRREVY